MDKYLGVEIAPRPACYIDAFTGERNGTVTPREVGRLIGEHLRFDLGDPQQGIFFLDEAGGETRVSSVGLNKPGHLVFIVPELVTGRYGLEVRALFNGDGDLRTGKLKEALTVG